MKNILLALFVALSTSLVAQVEYVNRIEFELKDGYSNEEIYEMGSLGFVLCSRSDEVNKGEVEWKFEHFNTDLESIEEKKIVLGKKYYDDEIYKTENSVYILFKNPKGEFKIVSYDAEEKEIEEYSGNLTKKSWIRDMVVIDHNAFFNASIKGEPVIMKYDLSRGTTKIIPINVGKYNLKKMSVVNFQILEDASELLVFVRVRESKKESEMIMIQIDEDGDKKATVNLSETLERNMVSISATKIDEDEFIITGTYSTKSLGTSEGLFFGKATGDELSFIRYHNFSDFTDFFGYLPEKAQEKIDKKKKKKEKKGKELKTNYRIADHDIQDLDDGYLYLGECYYPTYRTEYYTSTSYVNGSPVTTTQTRQVFDGYRYTHGVLSKFDEEGNLVWDRIFELYPNQKPFYVKRFITGYLSESQTMELAFAGGFQISSKSFDMDGNILKDETSEEIETQLEGDETKNSNSELSYWYDNYFIAYGSQKIKNKTDDEVKKKRRVFFVSKVKY